MSMDGKNVFQMEVEIPPVVKEKADAAFLAVEQEGRAIMKETKSMKTGRLVKFAAAAAACAVLLAAGVFGQRMASGGSSDLAAGGKMPAGEEKNPAADGNVSVQQDGDVSVAANAGREPDGDRTAEASDFSLTVYEPEVRLAGGQGAGLAFTDIGCGEGSYTGMLFQVQGDDIVNVSVSLDKGELYTTTMREVPEDVFYQVMEQGMNDEDGDPDTHTVYKLIGTPAFAQEEEQEPLEVIAYDCVKRGAQVTGAYDENLYYGFYIPDDVTSSSTDLAEAYREQLNVFDNSTLTVTIIRGDNSSVSKEYVLTVEKLALDENRNVTQQEWIEGGEGFVYGMLAKEK